MCGIAGYIGAGLSAGLLDHLLACMVNRGPDGDGRHHAGNLHIGMRRLSVIDLAHGWQPLKNRDETVFAFQNGEIYNYRALRKELEALGFAFRTDSDTEVLAHGYECWGIDGLLRRLDGMFAIAIHDSQRGELHLARDRMGEKPLFYSHASGRFGFGSTLLSVSSLPWVSDRTDPLALDRYLALHFAPGPRTLFADVQQVLPGERICVHVASLKIAHQSYFQPRIPVQRRVSDDELAAALEQAVESRLVADVPVGVFLSGGLDSSIVAAIAARKNPDIATFSMGFDDSSVDESAHAAEVARHVGARHYSFMFDQTQFVSLLPEVAAVLDTPVGDQAVLPVYWLSREARKHVTVVLSGEGSDEVFAGYGYYRPFAAGNREPRASGLLSRLFSGSRGRLEPCTRFVNDDPPITPSGFPLLAQSPERLRLLGRNAPLGEDDWEQRQLNWLNGAQDALQRATAADIVSWLPSDLLVKFDRMTMAHSLEGRAPFLDYRVVELGLSLPPGERMAETSKVALRRVAHRYLPADILARPKQGFVLPMRRWLRDWFAMWDGPARYFRERTLPGIDCAAVVASVEADLADGLNRERFLFALVMLAEWWQAFSRRRADLRPNMSQRLGVQAT